MKALTIKNPWSYLIAHGIKDVENRSWRTHYRGRILIHCSARQDKLEKLSYEQINKVDFDLIDKIKYQLLDTSCIIGEVDIIDCVKNYNSVWAEKDGYNWILENPILYKEPILNIKGKLSFWNYDI